MFGLLGLMAWIWWPAALAMVVLAVCGWVAGRRHAARIAAERAQESICDFARSFDVRTVDPWILRAVYEELSASCAFPVRAGDDLERDVGMDAEELGFAVDDIAARCSRSLEQAEVNRRFDRLSTVRDLVVFLNDQPSLQRPRLSREV